MVFAFFSLLKDSTFSSLTDGRWGFYVK
jgi:hypothetical protein